MTSGSLTGCWLLVAGICLVPSASNNDQRFWTPHSGTGNNKSAPTAGYVHPTKSPRKIRNATSNTIGEISMPPKSGRMRRIGASSGSVSALTTRTIGLSGGKRTQDRMTAARMTREYKSKMRASNI